MSLLYCHHSLSTHSFPSFSICIHLSSFLYTFSLSSLFLSLFLFILLRAYTCTPSKLSSSISYIAIVILYFMEKHSVA